MRFFAIFLLAIMPLLAVCLDCKCQPIKSPLSISPLVTTSSARATRRDVQAVTTSGSSTANAAAASSSTATCSCPAGQTPVPSSSTTKTKTKTKLSTTKTASTTGSAGLLNDGAGSSSTLTASSVSASNLAIRPNSAAGTLLEAFPFKQITLALFAASLMGVFVL